MTINPFGKSLASLNRMSHRIRKFVREHKDLAGRAATKAANETIVKNVKSRLTRDPEYFNWSARHTDRLYRSVSTTIVDNGKSVSAVVGYRDIPYAESFEKGGQRTRGSGPEGVNVAKITRWILEKRKLKGAFESIKNPNQAKKVAKRVVKSLIEEGAESRPILEKSFLATKDTFARKYLQYLNQEVQAYFK